MTFDEVKIIIKEYLTYHNYSPRSLVQFIRTLEKFNRFIEKKISDYRDVTEANYYQFINYLFKKGNLKKITIKTHSILLRRSFFILSLEEKLLYNPFSEVKTVKCKSSIRDKILSEKEISLILESIDINTIAGFRDRIILELLYGTGLRAKELLNLELDDFIRDEKYIIVRNGKGRKDRIVPLGDRCSKSLTLYIDKVRKNLIKRKKIKYIFINSMKKKLTRHSLSRVMERGREKSGLVFSAHTLRHSYATHLLNGGADIREIQLLLGHGSIKSTTVYLNLTTKDLKANYEKYHPVENELYFDMLSREQQILKGKLSSGIKLVSKKVVDTKKM